MEQTNEKYYQPKVWQWDDSAGIATLLIVIELNRIPSLKEQGAITLLLLWMLTFVIVAVTMAVLYKFRVRLWEIGLEYGDRISNSIRNYFNHKN